MAGTSSGNGSPLDLRSSFDGRTDVAQSLKTSARKEALALAGGLQQNY